MNDDTFIFLDEFLDTELYIFLNKCKEEILKFVWKDKNIEIIGKYQEKLESCYNTELQLEVLFDFAEIGYDAVINEKNKKLEELKRKGREYFKYLDELEILRREGVNTPKREEELIKKIEEREEVGKKYDEYKRNLKKWIKSLKDNEIINLLIN